MPPCVLCTRRLKPQCARRLMVTEWIVCEGDPITAGLATRKSRSRGSVEQPYIVVHGSNPINANAMTTVPTVLDVEVAKVATCAGQLNSVLRRGHGPQETNDIVGKQLHRNVAVGVPTGTLSCIL
jgi:hypothetical protein